MTEIEKSTLKVSMLLEQCMEDELVSREEVKDFLNVVMACKQFGIADPLKCAEFMAGME